jgi:predicted DNA-binding transcriptional regulator AlpA
MNTHPHTSDTTNTVHPSDPALRVRDAAIYIGMSTAFLAKARRLGHGPRFVRIGSKSVRYRVSALEEFLSGQLAK